MTRILLVRHATNDLLGNILYGRSPGVHLNQEGNRQAQALAQALAQRYRLAQVISSPLERALETATPIAEAQNVPLTLDEEITEINVGSWTGKSFHELGGRRDWQEFNRHRSRHSPPGGETMMQVQDRSWRSIMRAISTSREADATIAFVTHGDVVRCTLMLLLGMPIDYIHRLEISPASTSEIHITDNHVSVFNINQLFSKS